MINLDSYLNGTIDIQLNGKLIKVKELNSKQAKEFMELEGLDESDIMDRYVELLTEALNRNTSSVKFTKGEISEFPIRLIRKLTELLLSPENDPN